MSAQPDGYDITAALEADVRRLGELSAELHKTLVERGEAEEKRDIANLAVKKGKLAELMIRDELKEVQGRMIARQALLKALPR